MSLLSNIIDDRTTTSFGLSIGTGLALESLFTPTKPRYDENREIPINVKPDDYNVHAYNVYTILRNIVAAVQTKDKTSLYRDKYLKDVLIDEVSIIKYLYENLNIKPIFYVEDYKKIYKTYNNGKDVKPTRAYDEYVIMSGIYHSLDKLPVTTKKTLVFTSYSSDVISKGSNYFMLESHTGKVKDMSTMYTKYHPIGKRDMSVFPINSLLLYLLGDKYIVRPSKISIRVKLYNIAVEKHWNYKTTKAKIIYDTVNDYDVVKAIKEFKG